MVKLKLNRIFLSSSSYIARTVLGIRQKVEQIRANVFFQNF